ncbi:MAG: hypothetical protein ACR2HC_02150, partial [Thermoleophilaceae bacterium]
MRRGRRAEPRAAEWWGLQEQRSRETEVTVPVAGGRHMAGLAMHRVPYLPLSHVTCRHGLPITTVERTILDRAAGHLRRAVERDIDTAHRLRLFNQQRLEAMLNDCKGRAGTAVLRAVIVDHSAGSTWTRNDFEEAFLALIDAESLPLPLANVPVGPYV